MTQGPRTISSPEVRPSRGSSPPFSPTIFMSMPYSDRPCFACSARRCTASRFTCLPLSLPNAPIGLSSVIPQAWITWTPYLSSKASIMAGGQVDPPMTVRFMVLNFRLLASTCVSKPCQTVGTPADMVTPSVSNSSCSDLPSSHGPGNTSLAPTMHAT